MLGAKSLIFGVVCQDTADFVQISQSILHHMDGLIGGSGGFVIDANNFISQTSLPRADLDKFLSERSWPFRRFQTEIAAPLSRLEFGSRAMAAGFGTDFRVFREHPLMDLGDGHHLVLDLEFLEELVGAGVLNPACALRLRIESQNVRAVEQ